MGDDRLYVDGREGKISRALAALIVLFALAAVSCGPRRVTAAPERPATETAVETVRKDLAAIFNAPQFEHSVWAVFVQQTFIAEPIFTLNPAMLVMPASNMKILTLAAAAEMFGWDHRFETRIVTSAPLDGGTLRGDLIVVGGGDPSISERSDHPGVLQSWAQQLGDAGVQRIEGRIIGNDDAFDDVGWGPGWAWDDLPYGYSAPVGALEYNEGSVDLLIRAGAARGDPVLVSVRPEGSGLEVDNRLVTVAETGNGALALARLPGSTRLEVSGQIPARAAEFSRTASVDNATEFFVRAFRAALISKGIQVDGDAIDIDTLSERPDRSQARTLLVHQSPPLSELATSMMKVSQNQYAEMLLKALAAREGIGTTESGARMVHEILRALDLSDRALIMADGSGLSRYNYTSAETLARVLLRLLGDHAFQATLPIAGRDGTLSRRLADTPAAGNVRAKTGSFSNARAISGYLTTRDGETIVFSIIANNFNVSPAAVDEAADRAILRLLNFTRN